MSRRSLGGRGRDVGGHERDEVAVPDDSQGLHLRLELPVALRALRRQPLDGHRAPVLEHSPCARPTNQGEATRGWGASRVAQGASPLPTPTPSSRPPPEGQPPHSWHSSGHASRGYKGTGSTGGTGGKRGYRGVQVQGGPRGTGGTRRYRGAKGRVPVHRPKAAPPELVVVAEVLGGLEDVIDGEREVKLLKHQHGAAGPLAALAHEPKSREGR